MRSTTPAQPTRSTQPSRATGNTASSARTPTPKAGTTTTTSARKATPTSTSTARRPTAAATTSITTTSRTTATARTATPTAGKRVTSTTGAGAPASKPATPARPTPPTRAGSTSPGKKAPAATSASKKTTSPSPARTTTGAKSPAGKTGSKSPSPKGSSRTPSPKGKRGTATGAAASSSSPPGSSAAGGDNDANAAGADGSVAGASAAAAGDDDESAAPSEVVVVDEGPKIDPQIVELRNQLADRRKRVNNLEHSIQAHTHMLKAKTATERADSFQSKSTAITVDVRKMKKEIDALRHADRAVANLKDTLDNMNKHIRMRRAHIRQKTATIALMEQRSLDYAAMRRKMVHDLKDVITESHEISQNYEDDEQFAITVDPWANLKTLVQVDDDRETDLGNSIGRLSNLETIHVESLKTVIDAQRELATSVNRAADATAAELARALAAWDEERIRLEHTIAQKEKAYDEVSHHLRRGTNFLWTSQLQREDLRPLRELKLACDQHLAKLTLVEHECAELDKAAKDEVVNISRDVEEIDAKMDDTNDQERKLREANVQLREQYKELISKYPAVSAPPLLIRGPQQQSGASPSIHQKPKEGEDGNTPQAGAAAASSSNNNNAAADQQLIIDPVTGKPIEAIAATSVKRAHRRTESEEKWTGPMYLKPTRAHKTAQARRDKLREEQTARAADFRSRKPAMKPGVTNDGGGGDNDKDSQSGKK